MQSVSNFLEKSQNQIIHHTKKVHQKIKAHTTKIKVHIQNFQDSGKELQDRIHHHLKHKLHHHITKHHKKLHHTIHHLHHWLPHRENYAKIV